MSAFSQHDEMDPHECRLCDNTVQMYDEEGTFVGLYEILIENCQPMVVCDRCWWKAWRGANPVNISIGDGVHTLVRPAS